MPYTNTMNLKIIVGAASANFGILFSGFLMDLNTSSTLTAWIHNLGLALSGFCCYLLDPLVQEFGWRGTSLAMGFMMFLGLSLSAFVTSATDLFFSYSVLASKFDVTFLLRSFFSLPTYHVNWQY